MKIKTLYLTNLLMELMPNYLSYDTLDIFF